MKISQWLSDNGFSNVKDENGIIDTEFCTISEPRVNTFYCGSGMVIAFFYTGISSERFTPALVTDNYNNYSLVLSS